MIEREMIPPLIAFAGLCLVAILGRSAMLTWLELNRSRLHKSPRGL